MTNTENIDPNEQGLLLELYNETSGDPFVQVSQFDIGTKMGFDENQTNEIAMSLIDKGLAEFKSLSGGIAITEKGNTFILTTNKGIAEQDTDDVKLGKEKIIMIIKDLSETTQLMKNDNDSITELKADLKTIENQIASPRPKTSVVKECFNSIKENLKKNDDAESVSIIKVFIN